MTGKWDVTESCRSLPGENLPERLQTAKNLIHFLRNPDTPAPTRSRGDWTLWIKKNLYSLFDQITYGISPAIADSPRGEFMTLDVTVEEKISQWRIVLAVESELDDSRYRVMEILKDFDKLLAIKSAFKLMIFSSQKRGSTNEVIRHELQKSIDGYGHHLHGETYLFIDYNEDNAEGINGNFIAHIWQPEQNGTQKSAEFIPVN